MGLGMPPEPLSHLIQRQPSAGRAVVANREFSFVGVQQGENAKVFLATFWRGEWTQINADSFVVRQKNGETCLPVMGLGRIRWQRAFFGAWHRNLPINAVNYRITWVATPRFRPPKLAITVCRIRTYENWRYWT